MKEELWGGGEESNIVVLLPVLEYTTGPLMVHDSEWFTGVPTTGLKGASRWALPGAPVINF